MLRPLFLVTAGGVAAGALIIAAALPAAAATSGRAQIAAPAAGPGATEGTPVTFEVTTEGGLGITVPDGPVDLGTGAVGTTIGIAGNLGPVTVTDNRGLDPAFWTASVYSTNFTNVGSSADVIPAADATYLTGNVVTTPTPGTGSVAATSTNGTTAIPLGTTTTGQPVVSQSGYDGDNSAQWSPEIQLTVPATAVVGTYDATITHSVT